VPLAGHGLRSTTLRRRESRPQLKRDPLGGGRSNPQMIHREPPHGTHMEQDRSPSEQRRRAHRALVFRRTVAALVGSGGWVLFTYVAILGRRYHVAGWLVTAALGLYGLAFWWFVVRRF